MVSELLVKTIEIYRTLIEIASKTYFENADADEEKVMENLHSYVVQMLYSAIVEASYMEMDDLKIIKNVMHASLSSGTIIGMIISKMDKEKIEKKLDKKNQDSSDVAKKIKEINSKSPETWNYIR